MSYIAQQPEDIPTLFVAAWEERNAEKLASLFAEDADFINVTGLYWNNRDDIQQAHDFGFRVIFSDSTLTLLQTTVRHPAPEVAIIHAKVELTNQTSRDGDPVSYRRHTRFTFVAKKDGKQWMCLAAHNTEVLEGAQTFLRKEDGRYEAVNYGESEVDYSAYENR